MPIAITQYGDRLAVLCDDGAVFEYDPKNNAWRAIAPIPGAQLDH